MYIRQLSSAKFSKLLIPYYHKGFKHPHRCEYARVMLEQVFKDQAQQQLKGFIYGFNNLIGSINNEDFLDFATTISDKRLVEKFEHGLQRMKESELQIDVLYDPDIEEEAILSTTYVSIGMDQSASIHEQVQYNYNKTSIFQVGNDERIINIFGGSTQSTAINLLFDVYIKCRTSLKLPGQDVFLYHIQCHPYNYHLVQFLLQREQANVYFSVGDLWKIYRENDFSKFFGTNSDYEWKITNIDKVLRNKE